MQSFFFRALKIKNKQSLIKLLKDDTGKEIIDPNAMAFTMLTFLSCIIGQEEILSQEVLEVQDIILSSVNRSISQFDALFLDRTISADECKLALFHMGLEKSPGWDGITVEFFQEF